MSEKIKVIAKTRLFVLETGDYVEVGETVELSKEKVEKLISLGSVDYAPAASKPIKNADSPAKE